MEITAAKSEENTADAKSKHAKIGEDISNIASDHSFLHPNKDMATSFSDVVGGIDVDAAASDALESLSRVGVTLDMLPAKWRDVVLVLNAFKFHGPVLDALFEHCCPLEILALDPRILKNTLLLLCVDFGITGRRLLWLIINRPTILSQVTQIRRVLALLRSLHLSDRDLYKVSVRWPAFLSLNVLRAARVVDYLCSKSIGFTQHSLRSVVRRAPWVLSFDVGSQVIPAVQWLKNYLLQMDSDVEIETIIRACPKLLGTDPDIMDDSLFFLQSSISFDEKKALSAVRHFPSILITSVDGVLKPAVEFLTEELGLSKVELSRIVAAFPAILTLDVKSELRQNAEYLRSKGISAVGKVVALLPPLLSYDIKTNVEPKMEYILHDLQFSIIDVMKFPGYFSYSLTEQIEPRTRFLQHLGMSIMEVGLTLALTLTDEKFCRRVANVPLSEYHAFKAELKRKRAQLFGGEDDWATRTLHDPAVERDAGSFDESSSDSSPSPGSDDKYEGSRLQIEMEHKSLSPVPLNPPAVRRRRKRHRAPSVQKF